MTWGYWIPIVACAEKWNRSNGLICMPRFKGRNVFAVIPKQFSRPTKFHKVIPKTAFCRKRCYVMLFHHAVQQPAKQRDHVFIFLIKTKQDLLKCEFIQCLHIVGLFNTWRAKVLLRISKVNNSYMNDYLTNNCAWS